MNEWFPNFLISPLYYACNTETIVFTATADRQRSSSVLIYEDLFVNGVDVKKEKKEPAKEKTEKDKKSLEKEKGKSADKKKNKTEDEGKASKTKGKKEPKKSEKPEKPDPENK